MRVVPTLRCAITPMVSSSDSSMAMTNDTAERDASLGLVRTRCSRSSGHRAVLPRVTVVVRGSSQAYLAAAYGRKATF
jgi:hypothetical protein